MDEEHREDFEGEDEEEEDTKQVALCSAVSRHKS
jgi:hypothetical protein